MKKQNNPLREKLDAFSYEYDPTAWQAMEKKLDAQEKPKAVWWRLSSLLALLLVGLIGGTTYVLLTDSPEKAAGQSEKQKVSQLQETSISLKPAEAISKKQSSVSKPAKRSSEKASALPLITSAEEESKNISQNVTNTGQPDSDNSATVVQQTELQPGHLAQLTTLAYAFEATNAFLPATPKKVAIIATEEEEKPKKKAVVVRFKDEGDKFSPVPESWGIKVGTNSAITGPRDPRPEGSEERLIEDLVLGMYFTYPLPGPFTLQIEPGMRSINSLYITNQFTDSFYGNVMDVETQVSSLLFYDLQLVSQLRFTQRSKFELGTSVSKVKVAGWGSGISPQGPQINGGIADYEPPLGIRPWTYSLILGYEYKLSGRFRLSARYQRGLRDLSDPESYTNNQRHRGSDLQLTLKFQFNKPKRETW